MIELRKTLSIPATAKAIGRSEKSVIKKLKRMRDRAAGKLKPDPRDNWTQEQIEQLKSLRANTSVRMIAEITGRNIKTLEGMIARHCGPLDAAEKLKRKRGEWSGGKVKRPRVSGHPHTDHKTRARKAVAKAIASGRLVRQPCEVCGEKNGEAHHPDHNRHLEVKWLCPKHHRAADKAIQTPPAVGSS